MMDEDESDIITQAGHIHKNDHLGLDLWLENQRECYRTWGMGKVFVEKVDAYATSVRNMYNGPHLRDMLQKIIKDKIDPIFDLDKGLLIQRWARANPQEAQIEEAVDAQRELIKIDRAIEVLKIIDQLIEDHGYISHGSKVIRTYK
jgi:hypothetical protein